MTAYADGGHLRTRSTTERLSAQVDELRRNLGINIVIGYARRQSISGSQRKRLAREKLRTSSARPLSRPVQLADGSFRSAPFHQTVIPWDEEERVVDVIEFNGRPLLGVDLLLEYFLGAAMTDGGEVQIEPL